MEKNKTGKYLKYAVGEIILVIIGILIALGISENVKDRNNLNLRDLYIIQLNDEVDNNIRKLVAYKNGTIEMLKEVDTLIQLLVSKEFDNPKLASKSVILISTNEFHPIMITYENLKSSGDLKLFEDLNLRNSISESYETFKPLKTVETVDKQGTKMYYENYLMPNVSFWDMTKSSKKYAEDIYFQNMVLSRKTTLGQLRDAYSNSIESLKELKTILSELDNNNN